MKGLPSSIPRTAGGWGCDSGSKALIPGLDRGDTERRSLQLTRYLALALVVYVALLRGCAGPRSLTVGQSTEADVRARMGAPTNTRVEPNGDRIWEYPTGPYGNETHMVRIGPDGKVKEVAQLLSEDRLAMVIPGKTTKPDVRKLFGRPGFEHCTAWARRGHGAITGTASSPAGSW